MDAFDADVLIYATAEGHPLGDPVRKLFDESTDRPVGIGSMLLIPDLLSRPSRSRRPDEVEALKVLLRRLDLRPLDQATATLAAAFSAEYRYPLADAVHLATAVQAGAARFVTGTHRMWDRKIAEIEITYADTL